MSLGPAEILVVLVGVAGVADELRGSDEGAGGL